jgi:hypothetical protein
MLHTFNRTGKEPGIADSVMVEEKRSNCAEAGDEALSEKRRT